MDVTTILARFDDVSEEADGYVARCPAHDDTRPSLRLWVGEDRKVRLTCRAGCDSGDVVTAVGLTWPDLFDVTGDAVTVPAARRTMVSGGPVAALRMYVNATAAALDAEALAYAARRFGISDADARSLCLGYDDGTVPRFPYRSESYRQHARLTVPLRSFDGVLRGLQGRDISGDCPVRWVSLTNPDGQRWVPYGVMQHAETSRLAPWMVTEGPGDGLTAFAAGFNAVAVRGAALVRNPEIIDEVADGLAGAPLVILAGDNDKAGRKFNAVLGEALHARDTRCVVLDVAGDDDLTAWREADADAFGDALRAAVDAAQPPKREAKAERMETLAATEAIASPPGGAPDDEAYWRAQRSLLDLTDDMRHVNYAQFVADQCGHELRYVRNVGWFKWDGRVWQEGDDKTTPLQAITDASRILMRHGADVSTDTQWASAGASKMLVHSARKAIAAEMAAVDSLRAGVDDFDANRHLLTFENGTVDLRSGELRPHDPADMMTQLVPVAYKPDAAAPRWERFVQEIFPRDVDLQRYYQTFLGMCITGEVRDHALGVWYGEHGRNGKGATIRTMMAVFGTEIVREIPFETWELQRGEKPHTELIASLRNARMVVAQEGNQGVPMNTALLKTYSGGDRISARHLYGKTFSYDPKFTIVLTTNFLPEFSSGGTSLWSRTKAVRFGESFADRIDVDLEPTIQGPEREGVAAWVVRGAVAYYEAGRLRDPASVIAATEQHKDSVDPLKPLVGELFEYDAEAEVRRSSFNAELKEWRDANGEKGGKFAPSAVKRHLLSHGVTEYQKKGVGWMYRGVYLMSDPPAGAPGAKTGPGIFAQAG